MNVEGLGVLNLSTQTWEKVVIMERVEVVSLWVQFQQREKSVAGQVAQYVC